jgi:hypothetical protein
MIAIWLVISLLTGDPSPCRLRTATARQAIFSPSAKGPATCFVGRRSACPTTCFDRVLVGSVNHRFRRARSEAPYQRYPVFLGS